jgi:hypothetical protein
MRLELDNRSRLILTQFLENREMFENDILKHLENFDILDSIFTYYVLRSLDDRL